MKFITIVICLICANVCFAQFNESYVTSTSQLEVYKKAEKLNALGKYEEAADLYQELSISFQKDWVENNQLNSLHNHLAADLLIIHCNIDLRKSHLISDSLDRILTRIQSNFPEEHLLTAYAYHHKSLVLGRKETSKALTLSQNALSIGAMINANKKDLSYFNIGMGKSHIYNGDPEKSKGYYEKARSLIQEMPKVDTFLLVNANLGYFNFFYYTGAYQEALKLIEETIVIAENALPAIHSYTATLYSQLANIHSRMGNYDKALTSILKGLEINKNIFKETYSSGLLVYYFNAALYFSYLEKQEKSLPYLDTALQIELLGAKRPYALSNIYIQLAVVTPDRSERIKKYEEALVWARKNSSPLSNSIGIIYNNLGVLYRNKGDLNEALNFQFRAIEIQEKSTLPTIRRALSDNYHNISGIYSEQGEYLKAISYIKKAIQIREEVNERESPKNAENLKALAGYYLGAGESEKALKTINESFRIYKKTLGEENTEYMEARLTYSEILFHQKKYKASIEQAKVICESDKAEKYGTYYSLYDALLIVAKNYFELGEMEMWRETHNKALKRKGFKFQNDAWGFKSISDFEIWEAGSLFWSTLKAKNQAEKGFPGKTFIKEADIQTALALIDQLKNIHYFESTEENLQKVVRPIYDIAIEFWFEKFIKTANQSYIEKVYEVMEQSRSIVLNRGLKGNISSFKIPDSLLQKDRRIRNTYERKFSQFDKITLAEDSVKFSKLTNELATLQNEKEAFVEVLKKEYPDYYKDRYSLKKISLSEIQKQLSKEDKCLLYHYWADSSLYQLQVFSTESYLKKIPLKKISPSIQKVYNLISDRTQLDDELLFRKNKEEFVDLSYKLYKELIDIPEAFLENTSNIAIIPDGKLIHFPFEVLQTNRSKENLPYQSLPYLMRDKNISYSISAYHLLASKEKSGGKKNYLGFAPKYLGQEMALQQTRGINNAAVLMENKNEILEVNEIFKGTVFADSTATKANFLANAEDFSILHLAMHAFVNDTFPLESYFSYYSKSDSADVNRLHAYEIAQMQLDNDLVILSACNTNVGVTENGEGVVGLARSFQLAGSPNLLISNWLVDDYVSRQIIVKYFENISSGQGKSQSLTQAKLDYLQEANNFQAHPFYWATFTYFGETLPLNNSDSGILLWLFSGLALLFFGLYFVNKLLGN